MNIVSRPLSAALKERARTRCPRCQTPATPAAESTMTLGWYECECGEQWICRLRNGVPDRAIVDAFAAMSRELMRVA